MAARIPRTNLVFVILDVATDMCKTENCVNTQKRNFWPHFGVKPVVHASDKIFIQSKSEKMQVESRYRRSPNVCYQIEEDVSVFYGIQLKSVFALPKLLFSGHTWMFWCWKTNPSCRFVGFGFNILLLFNHD